MNSVGECQPVEIWNSVSRRNCQELMTVLVILKYWRDIRSPICEYTMSWLWEKKCLFSTRTEKKKLWRKPSGISFSSQDITLIPICCWWDSRCASTHQHTASTTRSLSFVERKNNLKVWSVTSIATKLLCQIFRTDSNPEHHSGLQPSNLSEVIRNKASAPRLRKSPNAPSVLS